MPNSHLHAPQYGIAKLAPVNTTPLGTIGWTPISDDIFLEFNTIENDIKVKISLAIEHNISPIESLRIQLLVSAMVAGCMGNRENTMLYIRKFNLERHFKFST